MAVRVPLRMVGPTGEEVTTSAVLNGGFEVPEPHLLLPSRVAERLLGAARPQGEPESLEAAGGEVRLVHAHAEVEARVAVAGREGPRVRFHVYVSEADPEVLVSDAGIDALGLHVESFAPGRWRLGDDPAVRESEPPQLWR